MSLAAKIPVRPIDTRLQRFVIVGRTCRDDAAQYPSVAAATYRIRLFKMVTPLNPGEAPALIDTGEEDVAVNLGVARPPEGHLTLLGRALSGRYIFNFNG